MNDYHYIYEDMLNKKPIDPEYTVKKFEESWGFIRSAALENTDDLVIVVTHHPPTYYGLNPRYRAQGSNLLNYAFYTTLEYMIPDNVKVWIHGHTHHTHDTMIGNTLVVANQLGYYMEPGYNFFFPDRWIEIGNDGEVSSCQRE
jgi:Icc-related predicted phosphoesterase